MSSFPSVTMKIKESSIESYNSVKVLDVNIGSYLLFDDHITNLSRKTNQKLYALSRVASYMSFEKNGQF